MRVSAICDVPKAPAQRILRCSVGQGMEPFIFLGGGGGVLGYEPKASLCWSSVLLLSFSSSHCKAF